MSAADSLAELSVLMQSYNHAGVVSQSDIRRMYDVKSHPLYKSGTWSEDQVCICTQKSVYHVCVSVRALNVVLFIYVHISEGFVFVCVCAREHQVYYDTLARLKGKEYEAGATQACLQITLKEFETYYEKVGEELDDDYFAAMIIQAWRLYKQPRGFNPNQVRHFILSSVL